MKKSELKALIKECYKEVVAEMQYPQPKPEFPDEPVGPDNPMLSPDEIIKNRLEGAKLTQQMWQILRNVKAEPSSIAALNAIKKKNFDVDFEKYPGAEQD